MADENAPIDADVIDTIVKTIKAGWKTSEFWIAFSIIGTGVALTSGLIGDGSTVAKIVGATMSTIKGVAYLWSRTQLKAAQ